MVAAVAAAAAATEARLRRTAAAAAPVGRRGRRRRPSDVTGDWRPEPGAVPRLPRLLSPSLPPRLLLLLFSLLLPLLLPPPREAEAVAAAVSGSAAAEAKECDRPCVNGGRCNPGTGQCVCPAGWVGEQCQHCGGRFRVQLVFLYVYGCRTIYWSMGNFSESVSLKKMGSLSPSNCQLTTAPQTQVQQFFTSDEALSSVISPSIAHSPIAD